MTEKEEPEKLQPIEVKLIKEKEKPHEEPEDVQYYTDLDITKEDIEEFEKDGT